MSGSCERRIAAIWLSHLPCELTALERDPKDLPFAVVEAKRESPAGEALELGTLLVSVSDAARRLGVRVGQTVAEARSSVAGLVVRGLTKSAEKRALGRVAEVALSFGTTVSIEAGEGESPFDTVWVDLTGSAHLFGGEEATLFELSSRIRLLGHRARLAIADGPRLARAACMFAQVAETIVPMGGGKELMGNLPLDALPISRDRIVWLNRLGLWKVGELVDLPKGALSGRLAPRDAVRDPWRTSFELASGRDDTPLLAYEAPREPSEEIAWDEPLSAIEPMLFALQGAVSRLSARLEGRGEAAQSLELFLPYDRSIARLRSVSFSEGDAPGLFFCVDLPSPLARKSDLFRVLKSKLERATLEAPATGLAVTARLLTRAPRMQLWIGGDATIQNDPGAMAVLLAEISAEIGQDQIGVLALDPVHRPEARTRLVPLAEIKVKSAGASGAAGQGGRAGKSKKESPQAASDVEFPTRLLKTPLPFEIKRGSPSVVAIDHRLFTLASSSHPMRFDCGEWWTTDPLSRDYLRVWLQSGQKHIEAWVFTDRATGKAFLHGYFD